MKNRDHLARRKKLRAKRNHKIERDAKLAIIDSKTDRRCDGCTACCTIIGVIELRKPYYETCKHVCDSGCAIYGKHPESCKDFICGWRTGAWMGVLDNERPDKIGIVLDMEQIKWEFSKANASWCAYEVWPGAADTVEAKALFDRLSVKLPVIVHRHGDVTRGTVHGLGIEVNYKVNALTRRVSLPLAKPQEGTS